MEARTLVLALGTASLVGCGDNAALVARPTPMTTPCLQVQELVARLKDAPTGLGGELQTVSMEAGGASPEYMDFVVYQAQKSVEDKPVTAAALSQELASVQQDGCKSLSEPREGASRVYEIVSFSAAHLDLIRADKRTSRITLQLDGPSIEQSKVLTQKVTTGDFTASWCNDQVKESRDLVVTSKISLDGTPLAPGEVDPLLASLFARVKAENGNLPSPPCPGTSPPESRSPSQDPGQDH